MIATSDIKLQEGLKRWASYLVGAVLLIAVLVLTGWTFDIKYFIHPLPKLPAMNPATGVAFVLFGISFFLLTKRNSLTTETQRRRDYFSLRFSDSVVRKKIGKAFAFTVLLIGAVKFSEMLFGFDSKIDTLLFPDKVFKEVPDPLYAHMSPVAAVCFMLAGVSLLLSNYETKRKRMPSHYMALIMAYFGLASFLGYIFTVKAFFGDLRYVTMAIHTGISFIFIAVAILFATSDKGLMKELTKPFAGSIVARRLIPMAVLIPVILGLVRLYLELNGIVTYEIGITVVIMCSIMALLGFIFYTIRLLNKRDFESKKAEESLSETNYFLNTILDNIPDTIFVKDANELRFLRCNKAGEELFGYSRSELIGKNAYDFHPKEQADFFTARDRHIINSNAMTDITEEPIMTKYGERWLHSKKIPVRDENGLPLYIVGVSEDITERRKVNEQLRQLNAGLEQKVKERTSEIFSSEQKFRKLLENNFETIVLSDKNFIPFYRSPATDRITGWTTEERIKLGGPVVETHPDDLDILKKAMNQALENPAEAIPVCFRTRHKEGHYIWLEGYITNMLHDESLNGIITNFRDVTIRKQAEEEIIKLTEELRHLIEHTQALREEERKYIAREIHDELGQRLTALKIDVSMMRRKMPANGKQNYFSDEINSFISQIDQSIESVKRIATDLRPEILDHYGIIAAVKWQTERFESKTGVQCKVSQLPEEINLTSEVSTAVYRTVQEALTNIARHAKATSVNIFIELDEKKLLVEIKDNGKGINQEQVKSMTSLGLIGIRERVHLLKGSFSITGNPGKGTLVSITIPIKEGNS